MSATLPERSAGRGEAQHRGQGLELEHLFGELIDHVGRLLPVGEGGAEVGNLRKGACHGSWVAQTVARAFVAECIEKHFQPHWDCMAENTASTRLAKKLGFTQSRVYTLYSFPLQP